MVKDISEAAALSKIYTNHCVRATSITLCSNAGFTNLHIMSISGHRNEQSLQRYNRRPSTSRLKHWSEVLSEALGNEASHPDHHLAVQQKRAVESFQLQATSTSCSNTNRPIRLLLKSRIYWTLAACLVVAISEMFMWTSINSTELYCTWQFTNTE